MCYLSTAAFDIDVDFFESKNPRWPWTQLLQDDVTLRMSIWRVSAHLIGQLNSDDKQTLKKNTFHSNNGWVCGKVCCVFLWSDLVSVCVVGLN